MTSLTVKEQEGEKEELEVNPAAAGGKMDKNHHSTLTDMCFYLRQVGSSGVNDLINPCMTRR